MAPRWHAHIPFEGNPTRRWVVPPIAVLLHIPVFLLAYQAGGTMAFGVPGFVSAALVGAIAGVRPGVATGLGIQLLNFLLARRVSDDVAHPILAAVASFFVCSALAGATGGLRALAQRMIQVNRQLDEHIGARQVVEARLRENLQLHRGLLATLGEGVGLFDSSISRALSTSAAC